MSTTDRSDERLPPETQEAPEDRLQNNLLNKGHPWKAVLVDLIRQRNKYPQPKRVSIVKLGGSAGVVFVVYQALGKVVAAAEAFQKYIDS